MIVSAAILNKEGRVFCSDTMPSSLNADITKYATNFLYSNSIKDNDIEFPYIETTYVRYVYKQTDDLYWLLITKPESDLHSDIRSLGKFVCTIMEYGSSDLNSATLTDEQRDLFYRHIWRPWDEDGQCPTCGRHCNLPEVWEREFDGRVQFLISIRDGQVDEDDVNYFNNLLAEAWSINVKLLAKSSPKKSQDGFYSESDSLCSNESEFVDEEAVIDGCRMKCRQEDIRLELKRIQDPYSRLFARRDLMAQSFNENKIGSAPAFEELNTSKGGW